MTQAKRKFLVYSASQADELAYHIERVLTELSTVRAEVARLRDAARRRDGLLMALLQECRALNERMRRFEQ